jgi:uncharacterized membrane protein YfcA
MIGALALAVLTGGALGALGGGGSILTLPILVYVAGIPAQEAVAMSMVVVGGTSLLGAVLHAYRGNFHTQATVLFALTGMVGAFLGSSLTPLVSQRILMGIFAALMLGTGMAMLRRRSAAQDERTCRVIRCLVIGAVVGLLTGFLGIGGGFMIVPALVLFAGIDTKNAMAASLAIITLNAAAGLAGQLRQTSFDWWLTLGFLGLAIVGMIGGWLGAEKVPGETLRKVFAWCLIVLALLIGLLSALGVSLPSGK